VINPYFKSRQPTTVLSPIIFTRGVRTGIKKIQHLQLVTEQFKKVRAGQEKLKNGIRACQKEMENDMTRMSASQEKLKIDTSAIRSNQTKLEEKMTCPRQTVDS
jgi:predicted nuclease with TOPRIM domain